MKFLFKKLLSVSFNNDKVKHSFVIYLKPILVLLFVTLTASQLLLALCYGLLVVLHCCPCCHRVVFIQIFDIFLELVSSVTLEIASTFTRKRVLARSVKCIKKNKTHQFLLPIHCQNTYICIKLHTTSRINCRSHIHHAISQASCSPLRMSYSRVHHAYLFQAGT